VCSAAPTDSTSRSASYSDTNDDSKPQSQARIQRLAQGLIALVNHRQLLQHRLSFVRLGVRSTKDVLLSASGSDQADSQEYRPQVRAELGDGEQQMWKIRIAELLMQPEVPHRHARIKPSRSKQQHKAGRSKAPNTSTEGRNDQQNESAQPGQPVSLNLIGARFELSVRRMPLQIDDASRRHDDCSNKSSDPQSRDLRHDGRLHGHLPPL
jgi:hypothetical protein